MKIIITEEQKKKLFIPRKIDEREVELKNHIDSVINSDKFQNELEDLIRDWWPDELDFNEWLDDNNWEKNYIYDENRLGEEISDYIDLNFLIEFDFKLLDYVKYMNISEIAISKLKEMGYL